MSLRSLPTRLLLVLAVLFAVAFNGDDASLYFSVSSGQIYYPGDPETSIELGSNGAGKATVLLRAFRVDDPVEFLLAQKDVHSPSLQALVPPNTFDMLGMAFGKAGRDIRYAARNVMPAKARRALRDATDLNGTKGDKKNVKRGSDKNSANDAVRTDDIPKGAEGYKIVASWEYKIVPDEDDTWHWDRIPVPLREKGLYLIEARIRGKRALTAMIISEYAMIVKQSRTELMSFVVNNRSGEKVTSMPLVVARGGDRVTDGETGDDGLLRTLLPPLPPAASSDDDDEEDWRWEYRRRQVLVVGERDGNIVISDPYYYSYDDDRTRTYIQTDRPVYRPGHTVYWKGILRTINDNGAFDTPNGGDSAVVQIEDSRGATIRTDTTLLSDLGTFSGELTLNDAAPLGSWSINVRPIGTSQSYSSYASFEVEEYKKPEYKVVVETDRKNYTRGDVITATAKANYYFGSPVANADIEYFVYRAKYWRPWWRGSEWAYLYESGDDDFAVYRMEMVASGEGKIGSDGTYQVKYETSKDADLDYVYRVQINVVDNSRRSISGAKSVEVTRGEFWLSTRTERYVYRVGDQAKLLVESRFFDGDRPVSTPYSVQLNKVWWEKKKNDSTDDFQYIRKSEPVWSGQGSTGSDGTGATTYTPDKAGYFQMIVTARDARGTSITESSYLYVADDRYADWYREGSGDVQIIPDHEAYRPGDEMSALIIMPAPNLDVLVTLEGGAIFDKRVERLSGTSAMVHFTLKEEYAPVVFLSASAIVNNEMYIETRRVSVVPDGKVLKVEVTPDRELYRPGSRGTIAVRALDEKGNPARNVELSIGMVDEAIYAIQPDITPDIQRFFYGPRWNEVETSSSLNFSFYGEGRRIDPDAVDALYGSLNRRPGEDYAATGGSRLAKRAIAYGDVKGEMFIQPNVRRNFKDMMFWTPAIRTDDQGRASVNVNFPDNLTTWRINVRAIGTGTTVGTSTARVIARKDLMVRMETPRFLIAGDSVVVATVVHNYLKTDKTTKMEFTAVGATTSEVARTLTLPAGGETRVDWKVSAPVAGQATLTIKALTDEESDAMQLAVPVLPAGMLVGTGASVELATQNDSKTMTLELPQGSDPSTSTLTITMTPSLAGALLGSLDELVGYPYGCVEQTMSRFLPTIAVFDALSKTGAPFDSAKRAKIPSMVDRGFTKLYGMQHEDGGWGWWENDATDPFMTAYVVYGMTIAKEVGFAPRDNSYESGVNSLKSQIESGTTRKGAKLHATEEAYMLRALARSERNKPMKLLADHIRALMTRDSLNDYGRGLLAQAALDQGMRSEATTIVAGLERRATTEGDGTHWGSSVESWHWYDDQVEATATVARAIHDVRGETDLVRSAIRWILTRKKGTSWTNTRQTATVVFSMVDLLKSAGELAPNYTVTVSANGAAILSRKITSDDVFKPEIRLEFTGAQLRPGTNTIVVDKRGGGRLISTARIVYHATGAQLRPSSAGFQVSREYYNLKREKRGETIVYQKTPFNGTVRSGDEIFVKVRIIPDRWQEFVMMEDPIPAGCEVVQNTNGYTIVDEAEYDEVTRKKQGEYSWLWWYANRELRDEKVSFFANAVDRKEYLFSYVMRAQIPGRYAVMPSVASLMYYPEVRGNGAPTTVNIVE